MQSSLRAVIWRLAIYATVGLLMTFATVAILGNLRFGSQKIYKAEFANVSLLENGNFVRAAGVEVGKVKKITVRPDSTVLVEFGVDDSVVLTEGSKAVVRYHDLLGARYLALEEGAGGTTKLAPGATIPLSRTEPALDLAALIGGFRPLFRALNPDQVNALTGQLIAALQGQGATIGSFLMQTAALTNTLADRDQLIGQVITNLNAVLGSFGDQGEQLGKGVDSLSELVTALEARKVDVTNGLAYASAAAGSIANLLTNARPPLKKVVYEADRTATNVLADKDWLDEFLTDWPDRLLALDRLTLGGDFFTFYLCDVVLKLNGKGGQPVYIKVVGQSTGRCTPQ